MCHQPFKTMTDRELSDYLAAARKERSKAFVNLWRGLGGKIKALVGHFRPQLPCRC